MPTPMRIRAVREGQRVLVKVLMAHQMDTGRAKDADGTLIPAWFIRQVRVWLDDVLVLDADWGPAVSRNPFLQFELRDVTAGAQLRVCWRDSRGEERQDTQVLA